MQSLSSPFSSPFFVSVFLMSLPLQIHLPTSPFACLSLLPLIQPLPLFSCLLFLPPASLHILLSPLPLSYLSLFPLIISIPRAILHLHLCLLYDLLLPFFSTFASFSFLLPPPTLFSSLFLVVFLPLSLSL